MPRMTVTDRAHEAILRHAQRELRGAVRRQKDGRSLIEISDELHANLESARFPDEPMSQTILRHLPTRSRGRQ